jgi:cytidylate kinase
MWYSPFNMVNLQPKLIGLSGTNGSGKDTVGHLLAEKHNFWFFSFTELFRQECRRRGIPVTRENTRLVSTEWRRESGSGVLIDRSMDEFKKQPWHFTGAVFSSLRNPYEADRIHELGGKVVWIDADPRTRYERIQANAATRGRADEDNRTFEEFLAEEAAEMHPSPGADENSLDMSAVKERADIFLENNTSDLQKFSEYILYELAKFDLL